MSREKLEKEAKKVWDELQSSLAKLKEAEEHLNSANTDKERKKAEADYNALLKKTEALEKKYKEAEQKFVDAGGSMTPATGTGQTPSGNKKYEVVKNPLEEKFKDMKFKKDTEEKVYQVSHLSSFMKELIIGAMLRFYIQFVWDNKGAEPKSINFTRFNEILKYLDITEEQEKELIYQYKKKDKLFQNQSDNIIALFKFMLPKDMNAYDVEQRAITIRGAVNSAYFKLFGSRVKYTMSSMKGADLSLLCPLDSGHLGMNPRDSLKDIAKNNPNAINYVFEQMLKKEKLKKDKEKEKE